MRGDSPPCSSRKALLAPQEGFFWMKQATLDNLHYNTSKIDGTQKKVRFAISAREDGKTTTLAMKTYNAFTKDFGTTILFRRYVTDVTDFYIESLFKPFEKFRKPIPYYYRKGDFKSGIVPVYSDKGKMIFLIVCLNVPKARFKSLVVDNPALMAFDEFIIDTRSNERYLEGEVFRLREAYKTFYREGSNIPLYFFGNPYSLSNPYFHDYGVNPRELAQKRFLNPQGDIWCAEYHELNPLLVEDILKRDPTHTFDTDFFQYAIKGVAINDKNIRIVEQQPQNFYLSCAFAYNNMILGLYRNRNFSSDLRFWVQEIKIDDVNKRNLFCFDFKDLVDGARLFSRTERDRFVGLISAMRFRKVGFASLDCSYAFEEIYQYL